MPEFVCNKNKPDVKCVKIMLFILNKSFENIKTLKRYAFICDFVHELSVNGDQPIHRGSYLHEWSFHTNCMKLASYESMKRASG